MRGAAPSALKPTAGRPLPVVNIGEINENIAPR